MPSVEVEAAARRLSVAPPPEPAGNQGTIERWERFLKADIRANCVNAPMGRIHRRVTSRTPTLPHRLGKRRGLQTRVCRARQVAVAGRRGLAARHSFAVAAIEEALWEDHGHA